MTTTDGGAASRAKDELRARLNASRRQRPEADRAIDRAEIRRIILGRADQAAQQGHPWTHVFAYEAMATEPGSPELLQELTARAASVFVPVRLSDNDLDWIRPPDTTPLGVDAIATASVVFVPALAIDHTGLRIGRGGGSYDRALPRVPLGVPIVALLYRGEILEQVPTETWDRRVDAAVTPDGWLDVRPEPHSRRPR